MKSWTQVATDDKKRAPKVDLYAVFGKDYQLPGTIGLAWTGGLGATIQYGWYGGVSFSEWRPTPTATAFVSPHLSKANIWFYLCNLITAVSYNVGICFIIN